MTSRVNNSRFIFVITTPRSGSSLLKNLLVSHSQLNGTDSESTGLFRIRSFNTYSLGEIPDEKMKKMKNEAKNLTAFYQDVANFLLVKKGGCEFVDKFSISGWRLRYLKRFFPKARFIQIIRDGRDSYVSALKHPSVHQTKTIEQYAKYWKRCVELPEKLLVKEQLIILRYEELVTEPEETLAALMDWLGYDFEEAQLDVHVYANVSSLGNRHAQHRNLLKPINSASVGRGIRELSLHEKAVFNSVAGKTLKRHGYQD